MPKKDYFDKLSCELKSKFGELLLMISDEEQLIEKQRQNLARISDFEPYSCFTRIDRGNRGAIDSRDIIDFL